MKPMILKEKHMTELQHIWSFFSSPRKHHQATEPRLAQFELLSTTFDTSVWEKLTDHITLMRMLEYQVRLIEPKEQIPDGYIGRLSCWNGEKLEYQRYLKIQVEHVEKKTLVSVGIDPSTASPPLSIA
jgi:hypothetical protein